MIVEKGKPTRRATKRQSMIVRMSDCVQGIEPCECKGKGHRFRRVGLLGCFSLVKEKKREKRVRSQEEISENLSGNLKP